MKSVATELQSCIDIALGENEILRNLSIVDLWVLSAGTSCLGGYVRLF